jgi:hypothetical protein
MPQKTLSPIEGGQGGEYHHDKEKRGVYKVTLVEQFLTAEAAKYKRRGAQSFLKTLVTTHSSLVTTHSSLVTTHSSLVPKISRL